MKTATEGIESVDTLLDDTEAYLADLIYVVRKTTKEWTCLKAAGGGRCDHAAAMLGCVRIQVRCMAEFLEGVDAQLSAMQENPFGE